MKELEYIVCIKLFALFSILNLVKNSLNQFAYFNNNPILSPACPDLMYIVWSKVSNKKN